MVVKDYPPPTPPPHPPPQKKKEESLGSLPAPQSGCATPIMVFFCSFILLIYSSQKASRSLKFCSALHILVLHMHRKFDADSIDSFWDMEEQSTRRKERKKERTRKLHLQANVTKKVIILRNPSYRLQALRESRPPWLRQIITPIFPNVIMLSLGGERLTPKVLNHYLHHDLGMQQLLCYFYAHLLILEYSDHQQNLISSSLYYPGALRKISSQSVHTFLSNVYSQTDRQTNTTKNITSFAKEVKIAMSYIQMLRSCNTHHIINSLTGYPIGLTGLPYWWLMT